jgi:hypothetical protein
MGGTPSVNLLPFDPRETAEAHITGTSGGLVIIYQMKMVHLAERT